MYGVCEAYCERSAAIKLVDALDLGSSGETHKSSNLFTCTNKYVWRLRSGLRAIGAAIKLVDALDLGESGKPIRVQVSLCPPNYPVTHRVTPLRHPKGIFIICNHIPESKNSPLHGEGVDCEHREQDGVV